MDEQPIFRTAAEAWDSLLAELTNAPVAEDRSLLFAVFLAGMSSALSIAFHYGTADLRAELEALHEQMGAAE